ncbi:MAG: tRNA (adenosine(37)-N6)-dimethylallyltransferase MiaA [Anaeroplasmataceae bacterium]|nr:tRNA (adenosine(37)-N6)-dimethylallyltransferase MiaA [Anaeroplasmataceae bacterium]
MRPKVIAVVGPTSVGKTKISIELAKYYNIEIISGDSVAIYKELNIGSAKPSLDDQKEVKHHLIDIRSAKESYSAADFQKDARKIINQNQLTLICGGTGLYIQAALFQYEFEQDMRSTNFATRYESLNNQELYDLLKKKDPNLDENKIHMNNRKRVLRALEVLEQTGKSIHSFNHKNEPVYDYFIVYLNLERNLLYSQINKRVDQMIENGLLEEVQNLYKKGIYPSGIGYKEFLPYFQNEIDLNTAIEQVKKNTRHLAKRQETWFKNQMQSHFYLVDINNLDNTIETIKKDINEWLE